MSEQTISMIVMVVFFLVVVYVIWANVSSIKSNIDSEEETENMFNPIIFMLIILFSNQYFNSKYMRFIKWL